MRKEHWWLQQRSACASAHAGPCDCRASLQLRVRIWIDQRRRPAANAALRDAGDSPVTAEDLVDADGRCAAAIRRPPTRACGPGSRRRPTSDGPERGSRSTMTECDVVKRAGPPEKVEIRHQRTRRTHGRADLHPRRAAGHLPFRGRPPDLDRTRAGAAGAAKATARTPQAEGSARLIQLRELNALTS